MEKPETLEESKPKEETEKEKEKEEDLQILPSDYIKYDYNYKVIVIGDSGVGKTSITYRATKREFLEKISPTLGFEYFPFVLKYNEKVIKLEIWDTCAIDELKTFNSIDEWIRQCKNLCSPETKFVLIGNKADVDEGK